jgi:hypothetical protein
VTGDDYEKRLLDETQSIVARIRGVTYVLTILIIFGFTKIYLWHLGWTSVFLDTRKNASEILRTTMHDRAKEIKGYRGLLGASLPVDSIPIVSNRIEWAKTLRQFPHMAALSKQIISDGQAKLSMTLSPDSSMIFAGRLKMAEKRQIADTMRLIKYMDQIDAVSQQQATAIEGIPILVPLSTAWPDMPIALGVTFLVAALILLNHTGQLASNLDKWKDHITGISDATSKRQLGMFLRNNLPPYKTDYSVVGPFTLFILVSVSAVTLFLFLISDIGDYLDRYIGDPILRSSLTSHSRSLFYLREASLGGLVFLIFFISVLISVRSMRNTIKVIRLY